MYEDAALQMFPTITGLLPNTTYKVKVHVTPVTYDYNPQYEENTHPGVDFETTFKTYATPISNSFGQLKFENVGPTAVDFSWRILVDKENLCSKLKTDDIRIYLNNELWGVAHLAAGLIRVWLR